MNQTDICIVGGGPAGAAAALTLARYTKHQVLLIEASHYETVRVGETVSAGIGPLLGYLGAEAILEQAVTIPAYGTAAAWGTDRLIERDFIYTGRGQGLHLDRRRFDQALSATLAAFAEPVRSGIQIRETTRRDAGWTLLTDTQEQIEARVIVDATGRQARIARRLGAERVVADRLVGLVCHMQLPDGPAVQTTLVETVPYGWWYTAPLPQSQTVAALMTDADLLRGLRIDSADAFMEHLSTTRHVADRLADARPLDEPRAFPAETHVLMPPLGDGWIAAGDASCAFDPLASLGIGYALTSGIQAARIADEWLRGETGLGTAYAADITRHAAIYTDQRREIYAAERRWHTEPFWARRQH